MIKSLDVQEVVEEIKDMLTEAVNPIDTVIEISDDLEKAKDKFKEVISPRKGEPADKDLYARVVAAAKEKFDVYPSAYANGWVVQEYKRRGGKYNVSKAQGIEDGFEESEIEDSFDKADMTDTKDCKCNGCMECKANGGCDMEMCKGHDNMYKSEELSDEEITKSYESDNEDEDKWDNIQKACWDGYEQQGMKDKGGRKVPNCVYVGKSMDKPEEEIRRSIFGTEGPESLVPRSAN
jgi:hypothetical protein